jgi:hypothetical protein
MPKVIKFPTPKTGRAVPAAPPPVISAEDAPTNVVLRVVWVVTVLVWPLLKYVVILDCVYQLFRMMWYWNTPGTFAGFTFMFHFGILVWFTWFVSVYQPKGL